MDKEYIEREVAKEKITEEKEFYASSMMNPTAYDIGYCNGLTMAFSLLLNTPAADVAPVTTLNELTKEIHDNAVSHGWWDEPRNLLEIVALCHSELSEAVEEYRAGHPVVWANEDGKPEGIATEMADCLIRILDWFGHEGLDADEIVQQKMTYNRGRPYKHGKRC